MQCPNKAQILRLHEQIIASSDGSTGLRDEGALESALAQPFASFGGQELYSKRRHLVFQ
jgi:death on curing protein